MLFTILALSSSWATGTDPNEDKRGVIVNNQGDVLQKITENVDGVQDIINECDQQIEADPSINRDQCVWTAVQSQGLEDQVIAALEEYSSDSRNPASDREGESYSYNLDNFKIKESESVKKLEEYLKGRLEKALHGEDLPSDKLKVAQDHTDFYRLWQSQLGKNLIVHLSSYCMYSNPVSGLVPHRGVASPPASSASPAAGTTPAPTPTVDQAAVYYREQNLKNLSQVGANNVGTGQVSQAYNGFEKCIGLIAQDCREGNNATNFQAYNSERKSLYTVNRYEKLAKHATTDELYSEMGEVTTTGGESNAIPHPCEVNRYMTGVKKALSEAEFMVNEFRERPREAGLQVTNIQQRETLNTDDVVNVSSGEILGSEEYKEAVAEEAAKLEECESNGMNPECENYLSEIEENKKIKDEFFIRGLALKKKLENNLTGASAPAEMDQLKQYFLDKGMSEENFARLLETKKEEEAARAAAESRAPLGEVELIKELISEYYENEREALQESLKRRLGDTERADPNDPSVLDPDQSNRDTVGDMGRRLKSSPEELATLYHYSNIVSSFIAVTGADGSSGRNTAALSAELQNNHFDPANVGTGSGRGTASSGPSFTTDPSALQQFADEGSNSTGDNSGATLDAGKVDQLQFGLGKEGQDP